MCDIVGSVCGCQQAGSAPTSLIEYFSHLYSLLLRDITYSFTFHHRVLWGSGFKIRWMRASEDTWHTYISSSSSVSISDRPIAVGVNVGVSLASRISLSLGAGCTRATAVPMWMRYNGWGTLQNVRIAQGETANLSIPYANSVTKIEHA